MYHILAKYNREKPEITLKLGEILLKYDFDPSLRDFDKKKPIDILPKNSSLYNLLKQSDTGKKWSYVLRLWNIYINFCHLIDKCVEVS